MTTHAPSARLRTGRSPGDPIEVAEVIGGEVRFITAGVTTRHATNAGTCYEDVKGTARDFESFGK